MNTPKELAKIKTLQAQRAAAMENARSWADNDRRYTADKLCRKYTREGVAKARKATRQIVALKQAGHRPMTVIAQALMQLIDRVSANAATHAAEDLAALDQRLGLAGRVINTLAPEIPDLDWRKVGYADFKKNRVLQAARNMFRREVMVLTGTKYDATAAPSGPMVQDEVERYIARAVEDARFNFLVFIAKMEGKITAPRAARIHEDWRGGVWTYSHLVVTLADGTEQIWRTQEITNTSIHGKRFPQWPSRIVKAINGGILNANDAEAA